MVSRLGVLASEFVAFFLLFPTVAGEAWAADGAAAVKTPVVMVEQAKMVEISDAITYPARVTSRVKARVFATSDGIVTKVHAPLGASVRSGAPLMQIKNTDPLYEYVPIAVNSPVGGVVSALEVTAGSTVTKGQPLATVIDPSQTELLVEVPAADLGSFVKGLKGNFSLAMATGQSQPLEAEVSGISPLVDPLTGTATAELALRKNNAQAVMPGTIGKVAFAINKRQGIQVPEQAIVYRGKETSVRVVTDGKAQMVPVQIAATRKGLTEVTSGLGVGSSVIVRASGFVKDGQAVVVENAEVAKK